MKKILSILMMLSIVALGACSDDDNDNNPVISENVKEFILSKYPGAVIRDTDYDRGYIEVEIYHDARIKDVFFTTGDTWIATKWDISTADLPAAVTTTLTENYPDYRIEDADFVVTPEREVYYIELERGNFEKSVNITADGEIVT